MSRGDPLRVRDYLEHIAEAIANIRDYSAGMDAAAYLADRKTQDAVVRNFEVIGEACNNVVRHHAAFAAGCCSDGHRLVQPAASAPGQPGVCHTYMKRIL